MPNPDRYLLKRADSWHYNRRTPKRYAHIETRSIVRGSLRTKSLEVARMRRDALEAADNAYWQALSIEAAESDTASQRQLEVAEKRYQAASRRAMALGFSYTPTDLLARETPTEEILERLRVLESRSGKARVATEKDADALLGAVATPKQPKVKVSKAFELYLSDIAFEEQLNKSEKQKYAWEKTKRTSIGYFLEFADDPFIEDITREDALNYRSWWMERMVPNDEGVVHAKPNTANRHIGNMRNLYDRYFAHIGQEDRINPFRKMFFKDLGNDHDRVPSFSNEWVCEKILVPGLFDDLNHELRVVIYVLIETGARTSEICNLLPEQIHLDADVPYIEIRPKGRELKTHTSRRDIPLVGVALAALKTLPGGFVRYRDKGELVSANLMKAFRQRNLFPTDDHVIYSFRHAFEDRMLEAGFDYDMRCYLMGHKNKRPDYGQKGSMEYRRELLQKICHPIPDGFFAGSPSNE